MKSDQSRADRIREALDLAALDGGLLVLAGIGSNDLLVDDGTIRDTDSVIARGLRPTRCRRRETSGAQGARQKVAPNGPRARVPSGIDLGTPPSIALDLLFDSLMREDLPTALVIEFAEGLLPDDRLPGYRGDAARMVEQLATRSSDPTWRAAGHRIVLVARTETVDGRLLRLPGVSVLDLPLPEADELQVGLELMLSSKHHPLVLDPGLGLAHAARLACGLTVDDASRLRFRSSVRRPLTELMILERRTEAIEEMAGDTLIVHAPLTDTEAKFAGLPQLHLLISETLDDGTFALRVVLVGGPGGGKTMAAKTSGLPPQPSGRGARSHRGTLRRGDPGEP